MKKSELRSLIRESIKKVLLQKYGNKQPITEAFKSKQLSSLYKLFDKGDKDFFQRLHNTYGIQWDKVPDDLIKKGSGPGINIFVATSTKKNPWAKQDWYATVSPGLIGATQGKKPLYVTNTRWSGDKGSKVSSSPGYSSKYLVGKDQHELNNFKRFNTLADIVYHIDVDAWSKYDPSDIQNIRKQRKMGAISFQDDKQFASENKARYEAILKDRIGSRTEVDKMIRQAVALSNALMTKAFDNLQMGKYGGIIGGKDPKGFDVTIRDIADTISRATEMYSKFVEEDVSIKNTLARAEKDLKAAKTDEEKIKAQSTIDYYADPEHGTRYAREYALDLKNYLAKLKGITP
jgi:hypothetical protein